jgi:hypothetical protein
MAVRGEHNTQPKEGHAAKMQTTEVTQQATTSQQDKRNSHFPNNGIDCADLHRMHHLSSLRNNFDACDVLSAAGGEKT